MVIDTACSNLRPTYDLVRKCQFCAFNEITDQRSTSLHALSSDTCWRHSPINSFFFFFFCFFFLFFFFNSKRVKKYLVLKSVKLLLGLSIFL